MVDDSPYTLLNLTGQHIQFNHRGLERMRQSLEMSGAPFAYSDYLEDGQCHRLIPYQEGALRDDFDFGKIVLIRSSIMRAILDSTTNDYEAAGWYSLRLALTTYGLPVHCPEPLYSVSQSEPPRQ